MKIADLQKVSMIDERKSLISCLPVACQLLAENLRFLSVLLFHEKSWASSHVFSWNLGGRL